MNQPTTQPRSEFRACVEDAVRNALQKGNALVASLAEEERALVSVTFALMAGDECVTVHVPRGFVDGFLRGVGKKTGSAGFVDVQFWLQHRVEKGQRDPTVHGVVIEVDQRHEDPIGVLTVAGVPLPNFYFLTRRGIRFCYLFSTTASAEAAEQFAAFLVLAIPGADPTSARTSQAQRVPGCHRQNDDGKIIETPAEVIAANGKPFDLEGWIPVMPRAFTTNVPGAHAVGPAERERIRAHLHGLGIVVPQDGSKLQARCPMKAHSATKAYVNVSPSGAISMHCCGDHDGRGQLHWTERQLLLLADGVKDEQPGAHFDLVKDVPLVWGGVAMVESLASGMYAGSPGGRELAVLALRYWKHVKSEHEVRALPKSVGVDRRRRAVSELHTKRLNGVDDAGPMRLFFCENTNSLALLQKNGSCVPISGTSFPVKTHVHERWATTAARVKVEAIGTSDFDISVAIEDAESKFDKAMRGMKSMLKSLGIPLLRAYQFPLAHRRTSITIDPDEGHLSGILVPDLVDGDPAFDVVGFLDRLRERGLLPFASREDVKRFVIMLAAPLLREVAPGLVGMYWISGPSGAGKQFTFTCAETIWAAGSRTTSPAAAQLSATDELELKRSFAAAGDALYVHAPEASKRKGMIEKLIQLSGSQYLATRGMRADEVRVRNTYTFVADSVEALVDRREIHRRTVVINVSKTQDDNGKGKALQLLKENAHHILAALKAKVETQPESWYREQQRTGTRPVVPVALSRLFDVELPEVTGGGLDDLFGAMHEYVGGIGLEEGRSEQRKSRKEKDGAIFTKLPSHRISHFLDEMKQCAGHRTTMAQYGSGADVTNVLQRECDYKPGDRSAPYLPVELNGEWFALKIGRANRNFIFVPERDFCEDAGITSPLSSAKTTVASPEPPEPKAETTAPEHQPTLVANLDEVASWNE